MKSNKHLDHPPGRFDNTGDKTKLPPDDFEAQQKFEALILVAKNTPTLQIPDNFTAKVMDRITPHSRVKMLKIGNRLIEACKTISLKDWTAAADASECAWCFFLTGFFYFILGTVLTLGLKVSRIGILPVGWIALQPQIAFITALGFVALGMILLQKSKSAFKIAQVGTILYIGFAVLNGIGLQMVPGTPFNATGMLCYTLGAILLGLFLIITLQKYQAKWTKRHMNYNH